MKKTYPPPPLVAVALLSTLPSKKNTLQIASSAGNVVAANVAPWPYDRGRNHPQEIRPLEALRSGRSLVDEKLEAKFIPSIYGIFTYINGGFFSSFHVGKYTIHGCYGLYSLYYSSWLNHRYPFEKH